MRKCEGANSVPLTEPLVATTANTVMTTSVEQTINRVRRRAGRDRRPLEERILERETDVDKATTIGDVEQSRIQPSRPVYAMNRPKSLPPGRSSSNGWGSGCPCGVTGSLLRGNSEVPRRPYGVLWGQQRAGLGDIEGDFAADSQDDFSSPAADEDPSQRRMRLEAVLLMAKGPLTTRKLAQLAHLADGTEARTLVRRLNQLYDELGRSVRIEQVAGGFRMLTRSAYAPWLARLGHLPSAVRLSSPMMETLAVVAYRGPVSRADVEAVRGVACGELLRQLMERDLIRIAGRSEELGRPYLYDTTKQFLQLFGLPSGDALPSINWEPLQEEDEQIVPDHSS